MTLLTELIAAPGEYRAGGTDVQERLRLGISAPPFVDLAPLTGLDGIWREANGMTTLGALLTVEAVAEDGDLRRDYPGLTLAAGGLATPQIRTMATLGGSLLQRTRCWYYRHPAFHCYKKGGDTCFARSGHHEYGVIFDLGPCVHPHPSTLGMALMAYEATVTINAERQIPISDLYGDGSDPTRDHLLAPDEVLTHVHLPAPVANERAAYFRAITRAEAEWPLVECIVRLVVEGETIRFARVAVGGVANIPLCLSHVEAALLGQPATTETFERAAALASEGATPLPRTGYKVGLLRGTVLETLGRAMG